MTRGERDLFAEFRGAVSDLLYSISNSEIPDAVREIRIRISNINRKGKEIPWRIHAEVKGIPWTNHGFWIDIQQNHPERVVRYHDLHILKKDSPNSIRRAPVSDLSRGIGVALDLLEGPAIPFRGPQIGIDVLHWLDKRFDRRNRHRLLSLQWVYSAHSYACQEHPFIEMTMDTFRFNPDPTVRYTVDKKTLFLCEQ